MSLNIPVSSVEKVSSFDKKKRPNGQRDGWRLVSLSKYRLFETLGQIEMGEESFSYGNFGRKRDFILLPWFLRKIPELFPALFSEISVLYRINSAEEMASCEHYLQ